MRSRFPRDRSQHCGGAREAAAGDFEPIDDRRRTSRLRGRHDASSSPGASSRRTTIRLIVALRAAFHLDYTEALLTQIVFFLAYGLLSLPAAWLTSRIGAVDMILGSLGLMAFGCLLVVVSTDAGDFWPILAALFVLAGGFTALQVAANPLAAELGPPRRSHFRLNFAQAFNSLGVVVGVHFGSLVMLGDPALRSVPNASLSAVRRGDLLHAVDRAFLIMAALLAALLLLFALLARLPRPRRAKSSHCGSCGNVRGAALAMGDVRRRSRSGFTSAPRFRSEAS